MYYLSVGQRLLEDDVRRSFQVDHGIAVGIHAVGNGQVASQHVGRG